MITKSLAFKLGAAPYLGEQCKFCGKEFKSRAALKRAVFTGDRVKPVACGECKGKVKR